jgi:integrase
MTLASRDVLSPRLQEAGKWVFPSRRLPGRHMGQHQRMWKTIAKRAGIPYLVPYDLRHTFATRAVERGVTLPELMAILGHANLRSIMKYVRMNQSHIARGMRTFEKFGPNLGQMVPGKPEKMRVLPSTRKDVQ